MRTVVLHGRLKEQFGGPFDFDIETPLEAVRALGANFPEFWVAIREGAYRVIRGPEKKGEDLGEEELDMRLGSARELHIVPVAVGSGGRGVGKVVLGVAMIGIAFAIPGGQLGTALPGFLGSASGLGLTYANVALLGFGMALAGVSQMLAPTPNISGPGGADRLESYTFRGPTNAMEQGGPVPLVYGRARVGSVLVSAGMDVEQLGKSGSASHGGSGQIGSFSDINTTEQRGKTNTVEISRAGLLAYLPDPPSSGSVSIRFQISGSLPASSFSRIVASEPGGETTTTAFSSKDSTVSLPVGGTLAIGVRGVAGLSTGDVSLSIGGTSLGSFSYQVGFFMMGIDDREGP